MATLLSPETIRKGAQVLLHGGVVAFPTETVYGLGGDAKNPVAIKRIFDIKGRPVDHPLIVHLSSLSQLQDWACDIPAAAFRLAETFWPGPLTLILKKHPSVPLCVTGGQNTVGLRIPDHPVALFLLREFGGGLAAPSANRYGRISPTTAAHVLEELQERVDMVLDGGPCRVGLESTIISMVEDIPRLLRYGGIPAPEIMATLKGGLCLDPSGNKARVSGDQASHYAPTTPLSVMPRKELKKYFDELHNSDHRTGVLLRSTDLSLLADKQGFYYELMPENPVEYARILYAVMRGIDKRNFDSLLVEALPTTHEWSAINDRLCRAAYKTQ